MLWLDTETYSEADLSSVGGYKYAEHPSTEVMLLGWAIDDGPVHVWDVTTGDPMPGDLRAAIDDPAVLVGAHNSTFDRVVMRDAMGIGIPIERWRDTMVKAYTAGLPGSLEQLCIALGMGETEAKIKDGKRLVNKFCKPRPKNHKTRRLTRETSPEDWARFVAYCRQDIEAMRRADQMIPDWNYRGSELELWHLDQKINDRGLPIDLEAVDAATNLVNKEIKKLNAELYTLTGHWVSAASQVEKLLHWLRETQDCYLDNLQADVVASALNRKDLPDRARRALEIRQQVSKTNTSKYNKLKVATCADGRLRGTLQFYGAFRTGRWAGRLFQPQNLARPEIKGIDVGMQAIISETVDLLYDEPPMSVARSCIRAAIKAPTGRKLTPSDLSNIEGRMLAWLAGEDWKLQAFRDYDAGTGPDLYKLAYARSFATRVEDVGDDERQIGKVQELALGFQGSAGAFASMAKAYNMDLDALYEAVWAVALDAHKDKADWTYSVQRPSMKREHALAGYALAYAWRDAHLATVAFWKNCEEAALKAVSNPGRTFRVRSVLFSVQRFGDFSWLLVKLPSKRRFLCYFRPEVNEVTLRQRTENGEIRERTKMQLSYMGIDQHTRRWTRMPTYGGKIVENITQAAARDVLVASVPEVEARGYEIIGSVHDETIPEVPDTDEFSAAEMARLMSRTPVWAQGLPLAAEGYESVRYQK